MNATTTKPLEQPDCDAYGFMNSLKGCTYHYSGHLIGQTLTIKPPQGCRIGLNIGEKITKAFNEYDALEAVVGLVKQADVPALLRAASKNHNEKLRDADAESQFYGEDIVSLPLANKIEKALANLADVRGA